MADENKLILWRIAGISATLLATVVLYFGKAIFLPLAASFLLCFVLGWFANWLEQRGVGRPLSVIVVAVVVFGAISGFGWLLFSELIGLSEKIPSYKANLVRRVRQFEDLVPLPFAKASDAFRNIGKELSEEAEGRPPPENATPAAPSSSRIPSPWAMFSPDHAAHRDSESSDNLESKSKDEPKQPVKVDVVSLPPSPLQEFAGWFGPLVNPLGALTMVIVLTFFMLLDREDFRNRMVRLLASSNLAIATTAITDASQRTGLWLRMMCMINAIYGLAVGIGLYLLGLPNPLVWGVSGFVFRFVPYIGGWAAAIVPVLLSFAVFEDWYRPLAVIGLYVAMDFVVNTVLEPWLYGKPIGLTSVGVILAVMFWGWLWGPVGLLLAVPLTLWLVVLGRYVPQFSAFPMLLGDTSEMPSYHTLYQRLLAFDDDEALTIWDQWLADPSKRAEMFDQILLPLLQRATADFRAGFISDTQHEFIAKTINQGLNDLDSDEVTESPQAQAEKFPNLPPERRVLVQPLHTGFDHIAARFLALELSRAGAQSVAVGSPDLLSNDLLRRIAEEHIGVVVISGVQPLSSRRGALLTKKLTSNFPGLTIVAAYWQSPEPVSKKVGAGAGAGVGTMVATVEAVKQASTSTPNAPPTRETDDRSPSSSSRSGAQDCVRSCTLPVQGD